MTVLMRMEPSKCMCKSVLGSSARKASVKEDKGAVFIDMLPICNVQARQQVLRLERKKKDAHTHTTHTTHTHARARSLSFVQVQVI